MNILQLLLSRRCLLVNIPQLNCQVNYIAISSQSPMQESTELATSRLPASMHNIFTFCLLLKVRIYNIYKASVSPGSVQQIMAYLQ
jgi:hypothetical protein